MEQKFTFKLPDVKGPDVVEIGLVNSLYQRGTMWNITRFPMWARQPTRGSKKGKR